MVYFNNDNKVNPELFKGEIPIELKGETYYAYIDSVEKIYGRTVLRFDCILKKFADSVTISRESILDIPSIIIEVSGSSSLLNERFSNRELYNLESNWMVINTSLQETELTQRQFFNFTQVGNPNISNIYELSSVILYQNLDSFSQIKIREIISATTLEESEESVVTGFLNNLNLSRFDHVNVYDVGQGNCNALVNVKHKPLLYYDVGGGSGANKSSYPMQFSLCHSDCPPVILSHWDMDHIQTAVYDSIILNSKWLVPTHTSISATAMHIAQTLINRGNLVCWNNSFTHYDFQNHRIVKCAGFAYNKNNSGLALFVSYGNNNHVLLPGDATFYLIKNAPIGNTIGIVASHHGAKASIKGMPYATLPGMLAYSYGNDNTHDHPHDDARKGYKSHGWVNGLETIKGSIAMTKGLTNFNPPCHKTSNACTLEVKQQF